MFALFQDLHFFEICISVSSWVHAQGLQVRGICCGTVISSGLVRWGTKLEHAMNRRQIPVFNEKTHQDGNMNEPKFTRQILVHKNVGHVLQPAPLKNQDEMHRINFGNSWFFMVHSWCQENGAKSGAQFNFWIWITQKWKWCQGNRSGTKFMHHDIWRAVMCFVATYSIALVRTVLFCLFVYIFISFRSFTFVHLLHDFDIGWYYQTSLQYIL